MVKLAANLSMLFNEYDFLDRFEKASRAGFKGIEYLFPYQYPKDQIKELLDTLETKMVAVKILKKNAVNIPKRIALLSKPSGK